MVHHPVMLKRQLCINNFISCKSSKYLIKCPIHRGYFHRIVPSATLLYAFWSHHLSIFFAFNIQYLLYIVSTLNLLHCLCQATFGAALCYIHKMHSNVRDSKPPNQPGIWCNLWCHHVYLYALYYSNHDLFISPWWISLGCFYSHADKHELKVLLYDYLIITYLNTFMSHWIPLSSFTEMFF